MNELEKNDLKELENTFDSFLVSKTSGALSMMLGDTFKHRINIVENGLSKFKKIKLAPDEMKICSVHLFGKGDTEISILYTIKQKYAKKIIAKLLGQESMDEISELGISAVTELGNIMTGSFLNALSEGTGFKVKQSTPNFVEDDLSVVVENRAQEIVIPIDNLVLTDVEFVGTDSGTKIHMLIMQDRQNTRKIIENAKNDSENN